MIHAGKLSDSFELGYLTLIHAGKLSDSFELGYLTLIHAGKLSDSFELGYLIGFLEGEGGFMLAKGKRNPSGTVNRIPIPVVQIYNTDRTPLEFIQNFLSVNGVKSHIYRIDPKPDKRAMWVNSRRKPVYNLKIIYRLNCLRLMRLLDGKVVARGKQEQFRIWKEAMLAREMEMAAGREQTKIRDALVMRRVADGESPITLAKEFGLKESTLYVMLHRHNTSVSRIRGGEAP